MRATLNDFPFMEHHDLVRIGDRGETMAAARNVSWQNPKLDQVKKVKAPGVSTYAIVIVVRPEVTLSSASWICRSV